jgi:drug/metabolite transporter (DMT)-like permease
LLGAGPIAVSALRLSIATIPVALVFILSRQRVRIGWRRETLLAFAGLLLAAHFATWITSLLYTSVAISTLLVCTTPIWSKLYEWLVERKAFSRQAALGGFFAGLGVYLIGQQHGAPSPVPGMAVYGNLLALSGAVALALYFAVVRGAGVAPQRGASLSISAIVVRTYAWAALGLIALSLFERQPPPPIGNLAAWGGILAMALVSQSLGHTGMNAALRYFPPSTVAMTTLLEPVIAAALAALIFREGLTMQTLIGGAFVILGVAFVLSETPPAGVSSERLVEL